MILPLYERPERRTTNPGEQPTPSAVEPTPPAAAPGDKPEGADAWDNFNSEHFPPATNGLDMQRPPTPTTPEAPVTPGTPDTPETPQDS